MTRLAVSMIWSSPDLEKGTEPTLYKCYQFWVKTYPKQNRQIRLVSMVWIQVILISVPFTLSLGLIGTMTKNES